jgi:hypothetical protein
MTQHLGWWPLGITTVQRHCLTTNTSTCSDTHNPATAKICQDQRNCQETSVPCSTNCSTGHTHSISQLPFSPGTFHIKKEPCVPF